MKKLIILFLLVANIVSLQYYDTVKHKRDNFALCGSSNGLTEQSSDKSDSELWKIGINERKNLTKHQTKDKLKEAVKEIPEHFNICIDIYRHNEPINSQYVFIFDEKISDNLFTDTIFKPS